MAVAVNVLRKVRTKCGLNKVEMARKLDISRSYYTMLENEDRAISKRLGIKLHEQFGLPLEEIFFNSVSSRSGNNHQRKEV